MRQISIQISSPEFSIGAFNGAIIAGNPGNSAAALVPHVIDCEFDS